MDPNRDHFAAITTLRGSVVSIPFLTEDEAAEVAEQYGPPAEPIAPIEAGKGDTQQCGQCNGMGYWTEMVEMDTPSGGKITTEKRVNCRRCGGTGRVPK
jgi:hypothetical protein